MGGTKPRMTQDDPQVRALSLTHLQSFSALRDEMSCPRPGHVNEMVFGAGRQQPAVWLRWEPSARIYLLLFAFGLPTQGPG